MTIPEQCRTRHGPTQAPFGSRAPSQEASSSAGEGIAPALTTQTRHATEKRSPLVVSRHSISDTRAPSRRRRRARVLCNTVAPSAIAVGSTVTERSFFAPILHGNRSHVRHWTQGRRPSADAKLIASGMGNGFSPRASAAAATRRAGAEKGGGAAAYGPARGGSLGSRPATPATPRRRSAWA